MTDPTLRGLMSDPDLGLRLLTEPSVALDRPLRWVHSSDLADPTPFLTDDLVLLTTGGQFDGALAPAEYVDRLAAHGVIGIGFGTGVRHPALPLGLAEACSAAGVPLFEVPYDTPFIAVARTHAEAIATRAYARRDWALETQRALAVAALRPHGLLAIIAELGHRLDTWVGLFDATGELTGERPTGRLEPHRRRAIVDEATTMLARGTESARSTAGLQLFTIGQTRRLRGVLVVEADSLDAEARAVITSVIAMAGLAEEQNEQLAAQRRRLHAQVLESLMLDDPTLAQRVLLSFPAAPLIVAITASAPADAFEEWWERRRTERGSKVFLAPVDDGTLICLPASDAPLLDDAAERFGIRIGASDAAELTGFSRAAAQARSALRRGRPGATRFADAAGRSILSILTDDEAALIATSRLSALHDADSDLESTLRVWLEHDARFEQAALALGIHRHTLRTRVAQAARLLGLDLSSFPDRAELWALLQASRG